MLARLGTKAASPLLLSAGTHAVFFLLRLLDGPDAACTTELRWLLRTLVKKRRPLKLEALFGELAQRHPAVMAPLVPDLLTLAVSARNPHHTVRRKCVLGC